ncbi:MAG: hypothetical protein VKI82_12665 [Leptolyngbya sp.]|nr:hypothetical protein [Leptolyngbya sp.]
MIQDKTPGSPPFHPHQIVYLPCDDSRLYTEVIDVLTDRRLAWVRPLVLVTLEAAIPLAASGILGLGEGQIGRIPTVPDLLWPLDQFLPALDTDFLALMAILPNQTDAAADLDCNAIVSQFTRRLWAQLRTTSHPDDALP